MLLAPKVVRTFFLWGVYMNLQSKDAQNIQMYCIGLLKYIIIL